MTPGAEPRLPSAKVLELIDPKALQEHGGIHIIEDQAMAVLLERCGVSSVSAQDLLKCLLAVTCFPLCLDE